MANFSEEKKNAVWQKANPIVGLDENLYRQDLAGATMQKDIYGDEHEGHPFKWEIDHKFPQKLGGDDNIENLQPMQWENNRAKGDDFPKFKTKITSNIVSEQGSKKSIRVEKEQSWYYKDIDFFKKLYPNNPFLQKL